MLQKGIRICPIHRIDRNADAGSDRELLPLELVAAIHRDLSAIDPSPFAYIQCYSMGRDPEAEIRRGGGVGPIPGAYHLLAGELPVPEVSAQQLREHARTRFELSPITRKYPICIGRDAARWHEGLRRLQPRSAIYRR